MAVSTKLWPWLLQDGSTSLQSMSLQLAFLLIPLLLLVVIIATGRCLSTGDPKLWKKQQQQQARLPPSPRKLPIIGNLHQLGSLPHRPLRDLSRKHGPLMLVRLGQVPTLVVSSAEAAREVMKTWDRVFANRPLSMPVNVFSYGSRNITFAPYGEHWRQAKKAAVVHLLSTKKVRSFRGLRAGEVAAMVDKISRAASLSSSVAVVDLSEAFHSFANALISRVVTGRCSGGDDVRSKTFRELIEEAKSTVTGLRFMEAFPSLAWLGTLLGVDAKLRKVFKKWDGFLDQVVEEHESRPWEGDEAPEGDFVDVLLSIRRDPAMGGFSISRSDIKGIFVDLVSAGTSTSSMSLEWAMSELVRNPGAMERAQREVREITGGKPMATEDDVAQMSYLRAVIKEVLRLHPPAPLLLPRESMEDTQVQGYDVPRKTRVLINVWAIARDPASWESPEEFRPERFLDCQIDFIGNDFQFIPFGAGRRVCPGISFAICGIELALANVLYHFDWALPGGASAEDFGMDEVPGTTVRRKPGLRLVAIPYNLKLV